LTSQREWRCSRCGKLLGLLDSSRLHISFARGHEYLVGIPAMAVCRGCRTLNELGEPRSTGPREDDGGTRTEH